MAQRPTLSAASDLPPFKMPSESLIGDLKHLSTLLHLLHHRNHNQHRRSTWYRHFNLFRRHLQILLSSIAELQRVPETHLARHEKKATDAKTELNIRQRLGFWRDVLFPKAQHAFSQVTADGRFAVLGVMLLATLASVGRILGLVALYEELGQAEVEKALHAFAAETWPEDEGFGVPVARTEEAKAGAEDWGEVLVRDDVGEARDLEQTLGAKQKACLGPEREVLRRSREALKQSSEKATASSMEEEAEDVPMEIEAERAAKISKAAGKEKITDSPGAAPSSGSKKLLKTKAKTKRTKDDEGTAPKPVKKKRKKNAIDELFSGL